MKAFDISNKPIISNDYVLLQEVENSIIANAEKMNQNRQLNIPVEYYLIDFKILIFDEMIQSYHLNREIQEVFYS